MNTFKTSLFTTFLVALLVVVLAQTTEARRSAPSAVPAKQDVSGLGLYGRGYPHAWGVDKTTTKNHDDVRNVVKKKKVQRKQGKNEEM